MEPFCLKNKQTFDNEVAEQIRLRIEVDMPRFARYAFWAIWRKFTKIWNWKFQYHSLIVIFASMGQSRTVVWTLETRTERNASHFCMFFLWKDKGAACSSLTHGHIHTFCMSLSKPQGSQLNKVHHWNLIKMVNIFQIAPTSWCKVLLSLKISK